MIKSLIKDIMAALGAEQISKILARQCEGPCLTPPKILMKHDYLLFSPGDLLDPAS
jgi:hypothetical protein